MAFSLFGLFSTDRNRKEILDPMVELQYQTMLGLTKKNLPIDVLERTDLALARAEFRKIEAIDG